MGSDSNGINNFHDGVERSTNNYLNKIFEISITNLFFFFKTKKPTAPHGTPTTTTTHCCVKPNPAINSQPKKQGKKNQHPKKKKKKPLRNKPINRNSPPQPTNPHPQSLSW